MTWHLSAIAMGLLAGGSLVGAVFGPRLGFIVIAANVLACLAALELGWIEIVP